MHHAINMNILDTDNAKAIDYLSAVLMGKVLAAIRYATMNFR